MSALLETPVLLRPWRTLTSPDPHEQVGAVSLALPGRTRIAVWEAGPDDGPHDATLAAVHLLVRDCPVDRIAVACAGSGVSVRVADLRGDGRVTVAGYAAPSVLRTCADGPRLVPVPATGDAPTEMVLRPGELLVMCSPTFLVEPPAALVGADGAWRPGPGEDLWDWAVDGLLPAAEDGGGAVALAQVPPSWDGAGQWPGASASW